MMKKQQKIFTDLIDEALSAEKDLCFGVKTKTGKFGLEKFEFNVDSDEMAKKLQKAKGHYTTINCSKLYAHSNKISLYVKSELEKSLKKFFRLATTKSKPVVMVVGLGNRGIVADSLGAKVTEKLFATMCLSKILNRDYGKLCFVNAGVGGVTGILSFDVVSSLCNTIKPDIVIIVDALVASNINRLGCSFQVSNSGISPGAGANNAQKVLDKTSLKCEIIVVGVPMLISGESLCQNISKQYSKMIFAPKEVDVYIDKCSKIIAAAINKVVHKKDINPF